MYKALYNFAGQEGEVALVKGELVEVKEKDENGMSSTLYGGDLSDEKVGGWSSRMAKKGGHRQTSTFCVKAWSARWMLTDSLKLVEQAPPPPPAAAPRRAPPPPSAAATNGLKSTLNGGGSTGSTPASSRPNSMIGNKGPPPAPKPKPKPSIPAKPTTGAKPALAPPVASDGGGKGIGQMDLAAALAKRAQRAQED
jgi:myosin-1